MPKKSRKRKSEPAELIIHTYEYASGHPNELCVGSDRDCKANQRFHIDYCSYHVRKGGTEVCRTTG